MTSDWSTIISMGIGFGLSLVVSAATAWWTHHYASSRESTAFERSQKQAQHDTISDLFTRALAHGMRIQNERQNGLYSDGLALDESYILMLSELNLKIPRDIALQWGRYASATAACNQSPGYEQEKLIQMMDQHLKTLSPK